MNIGVPGQVLIVQRAFGVQWSVPNDCAGNWATVPVLLRFRQFQLRVIPRQISRSPFEGS
ncbi:hypothetical protein [Bradyrhizobium elkanii]|uniref:hypothetical protein n=1 Tax=Bradyrhizobium elkanii TaxID=29448 RepID=UPI001BA9B50F|nr:hypothetical protein [Bradyrhizobium elkanii]MBR1161009.1 hypothetical protein [Bradyrhizobium elkanii]